MEGLMNRIAELFTSEQTFDDYSVVVQTTDGNYRIWYDKEKDIYKCDNHEVGDESLEALVVSLEHLIAGKGGTIEAVKVI